MLTACNLYLPVARERPARMILHDLLVQNGGPVAKIIKACCRRGPTREADEQPFVAWLIGEKCSITREGAVHARHYVVVAQSDTYLTWHVLLVLDIPEAFEVC
jgi:hypothetical protein